MAGGEKLPTLARFTNRCGDLMSTISSSNSISASRSASQARIAQLDAFLVPE
jgi:hypothetical protein